MIEGNLREVKPIIILLKDNNQGSIALAYNLVFHLRIKYIDIQNYYIRDEIALKIIKFSYILIDEMITDGLTKALKYVMFHKFVE